MRDASFPNRFTIPESVWANCGPRGRLADAYSLLAAEEIGVRFSLKWILAGMAYAAVAAAALSQDSWVYADVLWVLTLAAFAFALVVACFERGQRQIGAASFVAFSGCYLLCLQFAESSVPTSRLLLAWSAGDTINDPPPGLIRSNPYGGDPFAAASNRYGAPAGLTSGLAGASLNQRQAQAQILYNQRLLQRAVRGAPVDMTPYLRAGNAIATMSFGLLGCLLAPLAVKAAKIGALPTPPPIPDKR
jgi:hypothetical protein